MDLPVIPTTLTTSSEKIELYKALYSEYITHAVELHNYHYVFINNLGRGSCQGIRRHLVEMTALEKKLKGAAWDAFVEQKENLKILGKINKTSKFKPGTRGRGRPRKIKNDNN
jgi:uncharacterized protein YaaR (DUF327 family)